MGKLNLKRGGIWEETQSEKRRCKNDESKNDENTKDDVKTMKTLWENLF